MKGRLLSIPVAIGALLGYLGFPRVAHGRRTETEPLEGAEVAGAYSELTGTSQFAAVRRFFLRELEQYEPEGTLLDVGSGPGMLLIDIAQQFPFLKLIGIDASVDMVQQARANSANASHARSIDFRQGLAQDLPLADGSVDFVISSLSLHHWAEPEQVLREIHRVLRPGGQLLIFDTRRDTRRAIFWGSLFARQFLVPTALKGVNEPTGSLLSSYTPDEVSEMLEGSPFTLRNIKSGPAWIFIWARKGWQA